MRGDPLEKELTDMYHFIASVLIALTLVLGMGCGDSRRQVTNLKQIQGYAAIYIPPSATNVRCIVEQGMDTLAYGRFDIPEPELPAVLAGNKTTPYDGDSGDMRHTINDPWWQPKQLASPQEAEWESNGTFIHLLIGAPDDQRSVTVYFFNFDT